MLRTFQKHEKKILFGLVIFTALTFGITSEMSSIFNSKSKENMAGEIRGKRITIQEFQNRRQHCIIWTECLLAHFNNNSFYLTFQPPFDMTDIELYQKQKETYFDNLAWLVLMLDALADQSGMTVTPSEIRDFIKTLPLFGNKEEGFSYEKYVWTLNNWRVSEILFEEVVGEFMKINKYRNMVTASISANTKEAYDDFLSKAEEIKIQWLAFDPEYYLDKTTVKSQDELARYFQQNNGKYEIPQKVQIEYIMAAADKIQNELSKPSDESMQNYYSRNREKEYPTKSFVEAQDDIINKLSADTAKEQAIERITKAEGKITLLELQDKPIDFKELAKEFNINYQVTGFVALENISELEKEVGESSFFTKQVASAQEGEVNRSISTDKGHFIFRLLKKQGTYIPKLTAQLKEKVSLDFIRYKSDETAKSNADKLVQNISDKVNEELKDKKNDDNLTYELRKKWFETLAKESGKIARTVFFNSEDNLILIKPAGKELKDSLFKKQKGEFGVFADNNLYYVIQLLEKRVPDPAKFEAEQKDIQGRIASDKKSKFIEKWFEDIKKEVKWINYLDRSTKISK
ncbi:MAG: SurA N-terminal domain-containing protein [Planctomycetota bacterium]